MRTLTVVLLTLLAATLFGLSGSTHAQVGPAAPPASGGTPVPSSPPGTASPYIYVTVSDVSRGPAAQMMMPYDFTMTAHVIGQAFQPNERVAIAADSGASSVTVTADGYGNFAADMPLTWEFCGPSASSGPSVTFTASGDAGSSVSYVLKPPRCPALYATVHYTPVPSPADSSGGAVVVGTAVAVPSAPITVGGSGSPPIAQPVPTQAPIHTQIDVEGFGFVAGEEVTLAQTAVPGHPLATGARVVADALGRIQTTMDALLPPNCGGPSFVPLIVAAGDHGTAVATVVNWIRPMYACPLGAAPGPIAPGQTSAATTNSSTQTGPILSLHLHPSTLRAGHGARAAVTAAASATVQLLVQYPGGTVTHRTATVPAGGSITLRWRVPGKAGRGTALLWLTDGTQQLHASERVR